jgi:hypothetical protein
VGRSRWEITLHLCNVTHWDFTSFFWPTIIAHKSNLCLHLANSNLSRMLCVLPTSSSLISPQNCQLFHHPITMTLKVALQRANVLYSILLTPNGSLVHMTVQSLYSTLKMETVRSSEKIIKIYQTTLRPLWSSGQSSWLQIRRPGFDFRYYQKKYSGSGTGSTQPREYN